MSDSLIAIGEVVNTQGHRGAVRIIPLTDFPERFNDLESVILERNGHQQILHVEGVSFHKGFVIVKFQEIADMDTAKGLKESLVKIPREATVPLPEGTFYVFEIIGLQVLTVDGVALGDVVDVIKTGANDVYVVRDSQGREVLIPALKDVVREIDRDRGCMTVSIPEGLLD